MKDVSGSCAENPAYGRPHIDCPGRGAIATLCQCDCHSETRNDNYWNDEKVEQDS